MKGDEITLNYIIARIEPFLRTYVKSTDWQTGLRRNFSLKNRMIFEIQIVMVELIIFNSNAKQEEVYCLQGIFKSSIT